MKARLYISSQKNIPYKNILGKWAKPSNKRYYKKETLTIQKKNHREKPSINHTFKTRVSKVLLPILLYLCLTLSTMAREPRELLDLGK
jgi:hypothetical protein